MVGHASINLMLMNVSAIQALMASTMVVTMTCVYHNLAEIGELVPGFGKVFSGFGIWPKYVAGIGIDRYLHGSRGSTAPLEFKISIYKVLIYALHLLSFVEIRLFNVLFWEKIMQDAECRIRTPPPPHPPSPISIQYNTLENSPKKARALIV